MKNLYVSDTNVKHVNYSFIKVNQNIQTIACIITATTINVFV